MARALHAGAVLVAAAAIAAPALAQEPGSRQTREFVQAAAQSDEFEIMEATTALAESRDPQVRAFATMMIDAHRQTSDRLLEAVAKAGLAPPKPGLNNDQAEFLAALQSQRGADFDRVYRRQQLMAHHAALVTQQVYAAGGDQAAIKQAAAATVPIVSSHLQMAEQMQQTGG